MMEILPEAAMDQWLFERLSAAFSPALPVFRDMLPREQSGPAIVYAQITSRNELLQERDLVYTEFEFDIFAATARGVRSHPYEHSLILHNAINTGAAVRWVCVWQGTESEWEITCDKLRPLAFQIQERAGEYRNAGGRYFARIQRIG